MNILLTVEGIIGKDEFVVTDAPNVYITTLRITPEQAAHFGGNERIGIRTFITKTEAGVSEVFGVGDDNKANDWRLSRQGKLDEVVTPEVRAILESLEDREYAHIKAFLDAVPKEDLEEMYAALEIQIIGE